MVPNAYPLTLQGITIKHPTLSYTATATNIIIIIIIIIINNFNITQTIPEQHIRKARN